MTGLTSISRLWLLAAATVFAANAARAQTYTMSSTSVATCSGIFTDSGGVTAGYQNNEVLGPMTFTPASGSNLAADFTQWSVEGGSSCQFDALTIYDGPSTADPVIGTYCGTTGSPGTVISSHPTGALTFVWVSDSSVTLDGWQASVFCPVGTPYDDCGAAFGLVLGTTTRSLGGTAPDGSASCGNAGTDDWFTFTAPFDGFLDIDTIGSTFDTVVSVHTGCPGTPSNQIDCDNDTIGSLSSLETFLLGGQNVLVRVAADGGGPVNFTYTLSTAFAPADNCNSATDASSGGFFTGNLNGLSGDGESTCDCPLAGTGNAGTDTWFSYTSPGTGVLRVDSGSSSFDTVLSVHASCNGTAANELACNDDANLGVQSEIVMPVTTGQSVVVRLAAKCDDTATNFYSVFFDFQPPPPTNDDCANAIPVGTGIFNGWLDGATNDFQGTCGASFSSPDVWYRFTAPAAGDLFASTCGSHDTPGLDQGIDTVIEIVDACGGGSLTCDDDNGPPPCPAGGDQGTLRDSIVELPGMAPGQSVLIRVSNYSSGSTGPFTLNVAFTGGPNFFPDVCNGDGGDGFGCTPCPCGNDVPAGTIGGCINSSGGGARLLPSGSRSVTAPNPGDLRMEMIDGVPTSFAVLISGAAVAPDNAANPCFGLNSGLQSVVLDGLRCAVQSTQRHGGRPVAADGSVGSSTNGWGGASGPASGLAIQGGFVPGLTRHFQVFFREIPGAICMSEQNTTQAVTVTFEP